jgi:hypothetical protein
VAPVSARYFHHWWLLGGGALLGLTAAFLAPGSAGCVYHDTCVKVTSPGHDWCRNVALAKQWPIGGSFEDGESILRPDGAAPRGCRCYNDAEQQVIDDEAPECKFEGIIDELELAARQECQSLVPPGHDHNCWTTSGLQASIVEDHFRQEYGTCIGNCVYGAPPVGGSCPKPSPYECATGGGTDGDGDDEGCGSEGDAESGAGDSGLDDTGSDTSGGVLLDLDGFVACEGRDCEIDEAFARRLHTDPSLLLTEPTRLVYQAKTQRHVLSNVDPGSLAHALGLRTGDQLEAIDGMIIHDLDSALQAYVQLQDATTLEVRVQRGSQWLDFTYTLVP